MNYHQQLPNNLNTFRILFIVYGSLAMFFSLFGLLYAGIGSFATMAFDQIPNQNDIPFNPGYIFVIIGAAIFILSVISGTLCFISSKYIKETRNHTFIFVVSIIVAVTGGIFGILLCVFTLIEINKPHIKGLFYGQDIPAPSPQRRPAGNDGTV